MSIHSFIKQFLLGLLVLFTALAGSSAETPVCEEDLLSSPEFFIEAQRLSELQKSRGIQGHSLLLHKVSPLATLASAQKLFNDYEIESNILFNEAKDRSILVLHPKDPTPPRLEPALSSFIREITDRNYQVIYDPIENLRPIKDNIISADPFWAILPKGFASKIDHNPNKMRTVYLSDDFLLELEKGGILYTANIFGPHSIIEKLKTQVDSLYHISIAEPQISHIHISGGLTNDVLKHAMALRNASYLLEERLHLKNKKNYNFVDLTLHNIRVDSKSLTEAIDSALPALRKSQTSLERGIDYSRLIQEFDQVYKIDALRLRIPTLDIKNKEMWIGMSFSDPSESKLALEAKAAHMLAQRRMHPADKLESIKQNNETLRKDLSSYVSLRIRHYKNALTLMKSQLEEIQTLAQSLLNLHSQNLPIQPKELIQKTRKVMDSLIDADRAYLKEKQDRSFLRH